MLIILQTTVDFFLKHCSTAEVKFVSSKTNTIEYETSRSNINLNQSTKGQKSPYHLWVLEII